MSAPFNESLDSFCDFMWARACEAESGNDTPQLFQPLPSVFDIQAKEWLAALPAIPALTPEELNTLLSEI